MLSVVLYAYRLYNLLFSLLSCWLISCFVCLSAVLFVVLYSIICCSISVVLFVIIYVNLLFHLLFSVLNSSVICCFLCLPAILFDSSIYLLDIYHSLFSMLTCSIICCSLCLPGVLFVVLHTYLLFPYENYNLSHDLSPAKVKTGQVTHYTTVMLTK